MEILSVTDSDLSSIGQDIAELDSSAGNILFRLQALVCRITSQLARFSQETQSQSKTMEKEYRIASQKAADLTKQEGNYAPIIAALSLASTGIGIIAPSYIGKDRADSFSEFFKGLPNAVNNSGQMKMNYLRAESGQASSVSSLLNTKISDKATKSGEARNLQDELGQILGNIRNLFKKASD